MARFSPVRFPPGFFDLPADAGESLPLDVIAAWTRSPQTQAAAHELLGPFTLRGTIVASDTAGLTRLSQERSLIEILAMVSRPKELVHAYGRALGGQPIGTWAADNTLMFYPDGVSPDHLVSALLTLQDRIAAECEVGIGLAVHCGTFYELGRGIHGPDADRVELLAEDYTEAGELVVTDRFAGGMGQSASFDKVQRADLAFRFGTVYRVTNGPRAEGIAASDFRYPLPFTDEFYTGLAQFQRTRRTSVVPRPAYKEVAMVVVEREQEERDIPEVAALNDLALAAAVKRLGTALLEELPGTEIKTTGRTSLYAFDQARHALDFARKLRATFAEQAVPLAIGIDTGRVLLFELGPGARDVAGSPVNVASKLAQDLGSLGTIQLTIEAARQAGLPAVAATHAVTVSGVTLEVVTV